VLNLEQSDGVFTPDPDFALLSREAVIKEYFFGNPGRTLSPATQTVDLDALYIYRLSDGGYSSQ